MKTIRLDWMLPTQREDGDELAPSEIAHTEISMSVNVETFGWTVLNNVTGNSLRVPDLSGGTYFFRAVVVDTEGLRSQPVDISASIDRTAPQGVSEFTATVE